MTKNHRNHNRITQLKNPDGTLLSEPEQIEECFISHYSRLWQNDSTTPLQLIIDCLPDDLPKISAYDRDSLIKPVTKYEIFQTVKALPSGKAPGPNGINSEFLRAFWPKIGKELTNAIQYFFESGSLPSSWNQTHICLVPKKDNPICANDYRPISLCNINYKVIAKIMANRLRNVLPDLIGREQSAFIAGRSIFDNILLAQELSHSLEHDTSSHPMMLIKLDMEKAYDIIRWDVVTAVLTKMSFPNE
ncbi:hypothetical protein J5N97_023095 [Dioscorea zingiberensis]|uniref:Reverse transcriptase domain-containing protein n=1 Tax=Dioscorea zingiberensis TaxID=325984 RepID=A0A9D5HBL5_9LILI|nr:hypothetical protein J5N97_023095 [Dioscorea zingiberensis]